MKDYEQLYYDALYTIKKLKEKNEILETDLQLINKKDIKVKKIILEQIKGYKKEDILKSVEDVINILIKVKDGVLKFYIEKGYIYCENTISHERVIVGGVKSE